MIAAASHHANAAGAVFVLIALAAFGVVGWLALEAVTARRRAGRTLDAILADVRQDKNDTEGET